MKGSGFHLENLPIKSDVLGILEDSVYEILAQILCLIMCMCPCTWESHS